MSAFTHSAWLPPTRQAVLPCAVLLLLALALSLRLCGLHTLGVGGNDTILYYSLAEQWSGGNFVYQIGDSVAVYRPVLLGFNALALKILGHNDYAIKLANVLLDGVNLLLFSRLAWLVSGRHLVVLACAASYALLPLAIWASRLELPHTPSTFFVLLSCVLCARAGAGRHGALRLFFCGVSLGAAAMVHEELILLAAPLALYLLLADRMYPGRGASLMQGCQRVALFSAAPVVVAALLFFWQAPVVLPLLGGVLEPSSGAVENYVERFYRFVWDAIVGSHSVSLALLAVFSLASLTWRLRPGASEAGHAPDFRAGFFLLVPVLFVALYSLFFETLFARGFLPLVPLVLLGGFHGVARSCEGRNPLLAGSLFVLVFALLSLSSLASYSAFNVANRRFSATWAEPRWPGPGSLQSGLREFLIDARYLPGYATHWGAVYRALQDEVDINHRLLVLPGNVMYSPGRRALQTGVYFGDNVIFRLDHAELGLREIVDTYDVKWVLFTRGQLREQPRRAARYLYAGKWTPSRPVDLAESFGLPRYSVLGELQGLLLFLDEAGAVEIHPFAKDSFEFRVARLWRLP